MSITASPWEEHSPPQQHSTPFARVPPQISRTQVSPSPRRTSCLQMFVSTDETVAKHKGKCLRTGFDVRLFRLRAIVLMDVSRLVDCSDHDVASQNLPLAHVWNASSTSRMGLGPRSHPPPSSYLASRRHLWAIDSGPASPLRCRSLPFTPSSRAPSTPPPFTRPPPRCSRLSPFPCAHSCRL